MKISGEQWFLIAGVAVLIFICLLGRPSLRRRSHKVSLVILHFLMAILAGYVAKTLSGPKCNFHLDLWALKLEGPEGIGVAVFLASLSRNPFLTEKQYLLNFVKWFFSGIGKILQHVWDSEPKIIRMLLPVKIESDIVTVTIGEVQGMDEGKKKVFSIFEASRWLDRNYDRLAKLYPNEHVAVLGNKLIDHDSDEKALRKRIALKSERPFIYVDQVVTAERVVLKGGPIIAIG